MSSRQHLADHCPGSRHVVPGCGTPWQENRFFDIHELVVILQEIRVVGHGHRQQSQLLDVADGACSRAQQDGEVSGELLKLHFLASGSSSLRSLQVLFLEESTRRDSLHFQVHLEVSLHHTARHREQL